MRIVHVLTRFLRAGSEENTIVSCVSQVAGGHDVHVLCGEAYHSASLHRLRESVDVRRVPNLVHPISPLRDLLALIDLVRQFWALRPDIVHTHQSKAGILGRLAARLAGVPVIVHGVHIVPFENVPSAKALFYRASEHFCGWFTDLFVHVGPASLEAYARHSIGRTSLHIVAESGMATARFRNARPAADVAAVVDACEQRPFVLLSLAAFEPRKRLVEFLSAFRTVVDERPNVLLLLAGEGPQRAAIEAKLCSLELYPHVRLLGFREDPERLLAAADALVICSGHEGLPRAAVQARIAGIPIVTTDLPELRGLVVAGETGFLVPAGSIDRMADAVLATMDDAAMRTRLRERLVPFDCSPWDADVMNAKIAEGYAAALQRARSRTARRAPLGRRRE